MLKSLTALLLASVFVAAPASAQAFSDTFTVPGSLTAPQWVSNGSGQIVQAPDGGNALNFANTTSGQDLVSGAFNLGAGQYRVNIDYLCSSGTTCGGYIGLIGAFGNTDGWFATDDQSVYPVPYTLASNSTTGFTQNSFTFGLTGGSYRFKLEDFIATAGGTPQDAYFRNLSISSVPEPATWGMMMLGLGMVGYGLRSRRKSNVATKVSFA